jgi:3-hydroxyisobutyrate dehydrogenase
MTDLPTVALLGTGTMGAGMARNLAAAGLPLRVWNRTQAKAAPLAEAGIEVSPSAAEAANGARILITMLFDADSVESAINEAAPASGTIWVQMSTVGVEGTERLAELARQMTLEFVDAPVLGTKEPAEQGKLTVLASGPAETHEPLEPVFDAIGARTIWLGDAGEGTRLKLVANGWVLTVVDGIAQSLRLAEAFGLDPALFLEAISGGAMDAPYVGLKGKGMLESNFAPSFALDGALKDAGLIEEAAKAAGADASFVSAAREHLRRASEAGHGDKDMAAVYLAYE